VKIKEDISQKHSYDLFQLSMCQMYRKFDFDNVIYCLLNKTAPMLEISSAEMDCLLATSIMLKGDEKEVIQSVNNLAQIITDFYGPYRGHFIDVKKLWSPLQDDIRLMEIVEYTKSTLGYYQVTSKLSKKGKHKIKNQKLCIIKQMKIEFTLNY
jgi:hypothetical protein